MSQPNETIGMESKPATRWNGFHDFLVILVVVGILVAAVLTGAAIAGLFGGSAGH